MKCGFCSSQLIKDLPLSGVFSFQEIIFNHCCSSCYKEIAKKEESHLNKCSFCQKLIEDKESICLDCCVWLDKDSDFKLKHDYLFHYNEKTKAYFQQFKFLGDIQMSRVFSNDIYNKLIGFEKDDYLMIPIPLSKENLKKRGFNQVEELLISGHIPYKSILKKKTTLMNQSEKTREERLKMKQPFFVPSKNRKCLKNSKIVIIDDVYTTGRTILHAYDCLFRYKPKEIRSFSLVR